jgi:Glycosyltransferase family 87
MKGSAGAYSPRAGPLWYKVRVRSNQLEVLSEGTPRSGRDRVVPALVLVTLLGVIAFELHSRYGHGDIDLYHRYAQAFWLGSPPLRSLPLEYPPLSIVAFSLTLMPPLPDYITVFALWMLGLLAVSFFAFRRFESRRAAEVFIVYCVVGGLSTLLGRFDLVPAVLTVAAYWAARRNRFDLAYLLIAAGTLMKLYPLFLMPLLVIEQWRQTGSGKLWTVPPRPLLRSVGIFGVVTVAGFALARALNPDGWLSSFTYNTLRPIQVESVPATLLWVGSWIGLPAWPDHSFHSFNMVGPLETPLGALSSLALVGGCLWVYWRQFTGHLSLAKALLACVLVIMCTSKVFSPQYLIWVVPLVALVEGEYNPLWIAVCILTTLIYPFAYREFQLYGLSTPDSYPIVFLGLIGARNALLLAAAALVLLPRPGAQQRFVEVDEAARQVA